MTATTEAVQAVVAEPTEPAPLPALPDEHAAAAAAIERAADLAATLPGVPGRDEFLSLAMQARILSMSGAAPKLVQGNPYVAFHVAMVGRDLGISPSAALELIDVMQTGGQVRLSLSPQLLNGQIRRLGLGSIVPAVQEVDRCVAVVLGPGGQLDARCRWPEHRDDCRCRGVIGSTEFTWEDARMAGLVGLECEPGQHGQACGKKDAADRYKCAQGYKTYPRRMMWWRASGFAADDWFPEAGLGLYSPEELGAVVDENGRPIDPSTVELPEGYEPKAREPEVVAMADDRTVAELRHTIGHLPAEGKQALLAKWTEGKDEGSPYLPPLGKPGEPTKLPQRQAKKAKALVDHFAQRAAAGEWGAWEAPAPLPSEDSGTPAPEQAGGGEGREVPTPPADPTEGDGPEAGSSDTAPVAGDEQGTSGSATDVDAADATFREALEQQLAPEATQDEGLPPSSADVDAELERVAQAYEALTAHQQQWLAAAVAKVGLRQDQLATSAEARATFAELVAGAAAQPAEPPQDDLVARTEAIAAKAAAKAKPAAEAPAPAAPPADEPPVAPTLLDG